MRKTLFLAGLIACSTACAVAPGEDYQDLQIKEQANITAALPHSVMLEFGGFTGMGVLLDQHSLITTHYVAQQMLSEEGFELDYRDPDTASMQSVDIGLSKEAVYFHHESSAANTATTRSLAFVRLPEVPELGSLPPILKLASGFPVEAGVWQMDLRFDDSDITNPSTERLRSQPVLMNDSDNFNYFVHLGKAVDGVEGNFGIPDHGGAVYEFREESVVLRALNRQQGSSFMWFSHPNIYSRVDNVWEWLRVMTWCSEMAYCEPDSNTRVKRSRADILSELGIGEGRTQCLPGATEPSHYPLFNVDGYGPEWLTVGSTVECNYLIIHTGCLGVYCPDAP